MRRERPRTRSRRTITTSLIDAICLYVIVSAKKERGGWREREKDESDEIMEQGMGEVWMMCWSVRGMLGVSVGEAE